jgi:hypothetical protein
LRHPAPATGKIPKRRQVAALRVSRGGC